MLKKILLGILLTLAVFFFYVARQPSQFRVERSIIINAETAAAFNQVNDFHHWNAWSPWAKLDPNAKNSYEGESAGVGAIFSWAGNADVGEGKMTITESRLNDLIRIKLEFLKPFAAINTAEFTFKSEGSQTHITWAMSGPKNFFTKLLGLFVNCDTMIGDMFEKGLAQIKVVVEGASK